MSAGNGAILEVPELPSISELESNFFRDLEPQLRQHREQLEAHYRFLDEQRKDVQHAITKIDRMIRALSEPAEKTKKSSKQGKRSNSNAPQFLDATGFGLRVDSAAEAVAVIKEIVAEKEKAGEPTTFTQREVYRHPKLDWDQGKGSSLFRYLRSIEFIRKAKAGTPELWAIMDADAMDRELERVERQRKELEVSVNSDLVKRYPDKFERVRAYLQEHHEVESAVTLQKECGLSKHYTREVVNHLEAEGFIRVGRGTSVGNKIELVTNGN